MSANISRKIMSDPADTVTPRAVVIGHGGFAAGLISAVDQITGRGALLVGLSNSGMTPQEMQDVVKGYINEGIRVVFTDLPGGSATVCARRVSAGHAGVVIVSGVNLPALLDFVFSSDAAGESAARAAARGRETISVIGSR
jgi:PTS system N-acetylgalactosamine-specific IIA component